MRGCGVSFFETPVVAALLRIGDVWQAAISLPFDLFAGRFECKTDVDTELPHDLGVVKA